MDTLIKRILNYFKYKLGLNVSYERDNIFLNKNLSDNSYYYYYYFYIKIDDYKYYVLELDCEIISRINNMNTHQFNKKIDSIIEFQEILEPNLKYNKRRTLKMFGTVNQFEFDIKFQPITNLIYKKQKYERH